MLTVCAPVQATVQTNFDNFLGELALKVVEYNEQDKIQCDHELQDIMFYKPIGWWSVSLHKLYMQ